MVIADLKLKKFYNEILESAQSKKKAAPYREQPSLIFILILTLICN